MGSEVGSRGVWGLTTGLGRRFEQDFVRAEGAERGEKEKNALCVYLSTSPKGVGGIWGETVPVNHPHCPEPQALLGARAMGLWPPSNPFNQGNHNG
jgi:hypothetical protein